MKPPRARAGIGRPPFPPRLALLLGVLAVSTGATLVRKADAAPLAVAFWRAALAALVLLPLGLLPLTSALRALEARERLAALASGLFLALHFGAWTLSLEHISVASSLVLVDTTPLWVALAAPRATGERVSRATWLGIGVSLAGIAAIGLGDLELSGTALRGDALALLGAVAMAGYVLCGRRARPKIALGPYLLCCYGGAAAALGLSCVLLGVPLAGGGWASFRWILALALVPQLLGHSSYNYALGYAGSALVALATLLEPVLGSLLAWAALGEIPSRTTVAGGAVVLAGVLVALRAERSPGPA